MCGRVWNNDLDTPTKCNYDGSSRLRKSIQRVLQSRRPFPGAPQDRSLKPLPTLPILLLCFRPSCAQQQTGSDMGAHVPAHSLCARSQARRSHDKPEGRVVGSPVLHRRKQAQGAKLPPTGHIVQTACGRDQNAGPPASSDGTEQTTL